MTFMKHSSPHHQYTFTFIGWNLVMNLYKQKTVFSLMQQNLDFVNANWIQGNMHLLATRDTATGS